MTYEKTQALSVRFFEKNPDGWPNCEAIFACWIENFHLEKPSEDDWEECKDCFQGEFRNAGDFAEHICDGCGTLDDMPEGLKPYFDYEAFGRDLILGGDYWHSGEYYFNNK